MIPTAVGDFTPRGVWGYDPLVVSLANTGEVPLEDRCLPASKNASGSGADTPATPSSTPESASESSQTPVGDDPASGVHRKRPPLE